MTRCLRAACAALLVATVIAACDTKSQFEPSLPPAAGFRVDDGVLTLWTGTPWLWRNPPDVDLRRRHQGSTKQVWTAPQPGVTVERMDLLTTAGRSSPDTGGPLQAQEELPADYDWTKAGWLNFSVDGPKEAWGARVDVAQVLRESAAHPSGTYLFGQIGWMDASDVQRENKKSFLTVCTPDPQ